MQNISDFDNFSHESFDFLTRDKNYINAPNNNVPYELLILIIQYTLLLPIIFLCWIFMIRFLRTQGYITQTQADNMIDTLRNFPLDE